MFDSHSRHQWSRYLRSLLKPWRERETQGFSVGTDFYRSTSILGILPPKPCFGNEAHPRALWQRKGRGGRRQEWWRMRREGRMWVKSRRQNREECVLSRGATGKNETSFLLGFCCWTWGVWESEDEHKVCRLEASFWYSSTIEHFTIPLPLQPRGLFSQLACVLPHSLAHNCAHRTCTHIYARTVLFSRVLSVIPPALNACFPTVNQCDVVWNPLAQSPW